jgi:hypothetical protein
MTNENPASTPTEESPRDSQLTIVTNCMKFHPGQHILATPGALELMSKHGVEPLQMLTRFVHGDWGDCPADDAALNEQALVDGSRLMGVYKLVAAEILEATPHKQRQDLPTIWIIADATTFEKDDPRERHVTTFLCPSEY